MPVRPHPPTSSCPRRSGSSERWGQLQPPPPQRTARHTLAPAAATEMPALTAQDDSGDVGSPGSAACCLCLTLHAAARSGLGPTSPLAAPTGSALPCPSPLPLRAPQPLSFLAVLPHGRGPGPPGLQGEGSGLPAHLGPLSSPISLSCCVTLGEGSAFSGQSDSSCA